MKIYGLIIIVFLLITGCSTESTEAQYYLELSPIESIILPANLKVNTTHAIPVFYKKKTSCSVFDGFYYDKELNVRTIAVQSIVPVNSTCLAIDEAPVEVTLNFKPTELGSYVFKIWKGKNASGVDVYEEFEVPVIE